MPTWNSFSPRAGLVYDVFGNQKTAAKFSIGRYEQAGTTGFSESYNPLQLTTASVSWTDLNGDGVPQGELGCRYQTPGCEINLAQLPTGFGVASLANFDPNIQRMYNVETSISLQQELRPGVSVQGGWYHRDFHNLRRRDNTLRTFADYTPFTLYSPIDGAPITYYNVSAAAVPQGQLRGHHRRRRTEDVVQRLRVQLQRAAEVRRHAVRRRHERESDRPGLRRTVEPESAALLRSDQERNPVPHAVQDRRQRADQMGHPGRLLVPEPARLRLRHRRALGPRRRTDGPDGSAVGDAAEHAERRGHGVAHHADHPLHCDEPVRGEGLRAR